MADFTPFTWRGNGRAIGPGNRLTLQSARDALATAAVWVATGMVIAVFLWIVGDVLWHGLPAVDWDFLIDAPMDAGRAGGIGPILVSTVLVLAVCMGVVVPVGVGTAMFLAEICPREGTFGMLVRRLLDVLAGVPSIVFGLFGAVFFGQVLGLGTSILSGGLTLACMVLPILIRTTEAAFSGVSDAHRQGAVALGLGRVSLLFRVLLPLAAPGLAVGLILGIGRALAETAALIFTSGYVDRMPSSLLDSGRVLSIHIFDLAMNVPGGDAHAYAAATVLVGLLLAINLVAGWLTRNWLGRPVVAA